MPTIPFPNVPAVPGVPPLPRLAGVSIPPVVRVSLGALQGALWRVLQIQNQWGIFNAAGEPITDPRRFQGFAGDLLSALGGATVSTGALDYSKETRVSDFPIERGSFASYNKAENPAAPVVTLCMSGSESERKKFLDAIDAACKSTELYSIVTPEVTYVEYNIERYGYRRTNSKGANLLILDIALREIRQVSAQYTQSNTNAQVGTTKDAGAAKQVDTGKVQAKTPAQSTLKNLANKVGEVGESLLELIQ